MKNFEVSLNVSFFIGFSNKEDLVYYILDDYELEGISGDFEEFLSAHFGIILIEKGTKLGVYYSGDEIEKVEILNKRFSAKDKDLINEFFIEFIKQEGIENEIYFSILGNEEIESEDEDY